MKGTQIQSEEFVSQLLDIIATEGMIERDQLTMDAELESFSIESADYVMILMAIEEKFGVYVSVDDELTDAKTLGELVEAIKSKVDESKLEKLVS